MTDSTILSEPMIESSTIIEPRGHDSDPAQSAHKEPDAPEPKEPAAGAKESRIDTIKRAEADLEKANAAKEPVAAKEDAPKEPETKTTQPAKEEADAAPEAPKSPKPSEGRKIIEAPARFLPRAKELWNNVPHPVREEFERVMKESETEITSYREAKAFRDELKQYDDMARSVGTTVKQSLDNYVAIERKFAEDPAQGFRQLMSNLGMQPPQAISHILRAYGVTPQQLAAHMQQSPNEYTALAPQRQMQPQMQQPQQAPQQAADPRVQQLEQRLQSMEAERVHNSVIAPFAQEYPEYYQFEGQIAEVLKSGIIDTIHGAGLSPRDKLEAALLMVAPNTRRSIQGNPANTVQDTEPYSTPAVDLRGTKSIKGAPTSGTDQSGRRGKSMSRTEAIAAAAAELGVRL